MGNKTSAQNQQKQEQLKDKSANSKDSQAVNSSKSETFYSSAAQLSGTRSGTAEKPNSLKQVCGSNIQLFNVLYKLF